MDTFNSEVGGRVREKRLALKLSRHKLAQTVNISDKFLYDIEMGKKGMSARTLLRLAEALNVSAGWLLAEKRSRRRK